MTRTATDPGQDLADRVQAVLDADVRPYLAMHAGDIEIEELTADGVLRVHLTGQCARCPAAQDEIGSFVTTAVLDAVPEVTDVRADIGVSEELLAQARLLLLAPHPRPRPGGRGRAGDPGR